MVNNESTTLGQKPFERQTFDLHNISQTFLWGHLANNSLHIVQVDHMSFGQMVFDQKSRKETPTLQVIFEVILLGLVGPDVLDLRPGVKVIKLFSFVADDEA